MDCCICGKEATHFLGDETQIRFAYCKEHYPRHIGDNKSNQVEPQVILPEPNPTCEKFIVRLYDGFDNGWMDVTGPITKEEAEKVWNEKTDNGKHHKSFDDIDYYAIFPADTKMVYKL